MHARAMRLEVNSPFIVAGATREAPLCCVSALGSHGAVMTVPVAALSSQADPVQG